MNHFTATDKVGNQDVKGINQKGHGFTDIFIRRPVLSIVISLFVFILGLVSYFYLGVREFPFVDNAVITISVGYDGASPEVIESQITTPIENTLGGINGIDYISSESSYGSSKVSVHFVLGYDVNTAMADVTSKVGSARWRLPSDAKDPVVEKRDPNSKPIMFLGFHSDRMSTGELTDYIERIVQPQLQVIDGVGTADFDGGASYAMRLWLNPYAMAARDITPRDVYQALVSGEFQAATGSIENTWQEFTINALTGLTTVDQFNALVIKNNNGQLTRLADIGRAELAGRYSDFSISIDGKPGALLRIIPKSDANPLDVSHLVQKALQGAQKYFPSAMQVHILMDSAKYIKASIAEINETFVAAVIFVMIIVFCFLGSMRILIIPAVTIPLSIVGVFSIMLLLGYSLNTLTLLSLVLAVGLVVDDAIVVVENIHRHICNGKAAFEAALIGAREIQFAIIAITLTLAAVYLPIAFTSGITKVLFKEFAFTLAATVVISGFVALTLSPMMCSKIMSTNSMDNRFATMTHKLMDRIVGRYTALLRKVLIKPLLVSAFLASALAACAAIYYFLPQDLAPQEDVGRIWTDFSAPPAANFAFTQKYADKLHAIYHDIAEIEHYGMAIFSNEGHAFLTLKPWGERQRNLQEIMQELKHRYASIPGLQIFAYNPRSLPGSGGSFGQLHIALQSTGSYEELNDVVQKLKNVVKKNPHIVNVDTNLKIDQPQLDVVINRDKAGVLGVAIQDITDALNLAFGEPGTTRFTMKGRSYDVVPQLDAPYKDRFDAIKNLQLRTAAGQLVPLSNLVTLKESVQPRILSHFQQIRYADLSATLTDGYSIGDALRYTEAVAKTIMPDNMKIDYLGQSRQFVEAANKMFMAFTLAIVFIFLILAAQFESFRAPLIVMFSVPLSILGALLALVVIHGSLNIYSEIGLITLIGLISKHGILLVEFANQQQRRGLCCYDAIVEAAKTRLRPILMTTLAMICGALPLALATGAGAVSRQQIGWVIVGGMSIGTLFTLFVVPAIYILMENGFSGYSADRLEQFGFTGGALLDRRM